MQSRSRFTSRSQIFEGQTLDFSRRAELSEWMDEPCSYEEFRACLRDLAAVNRLTFAYRPTRVWLDRLVARVGRGAFEQRPLHIVDIGSGQGDMLRYLARWARRRLIPVRLTGVDLNPYAARAASAFNASGVSMEWVTGDAFCFSAPEGIDVVISSLFTHHLPDAEIGRFLRWMEAEARLGWFINDLHRGRAAYELFRLLAHAARWHSFVQHDGPVSIRRSFRRADWVRYLAAAGLGDAAVSSSPVVIEEFRPARLCVGRLK
jgi:SAM-dependent methyltransferase